MRSTIEPFPDITKSRQSNVNLTPRRTIVALLATNLVAQMLYLNVSALVPVFVNKYHDFDDLSIGILFTSYQIVYIIISPVIGLYLEQIGRRRALFISIWLSTISTSVYAASGYIEGDTWFYTCCCFARVLQGIADAFLRITIPSIIATEFPEKINRY